MSVWTEPSPSDFERWELLLVEGVEPSKAAREVGHTCSAFRRADHERHHAALELSREVREADANELGRKWALPADADPRLKLAYLKAESSRYRQGDTSHVEVSGRDGGAIELEARTVTRISDVVELLQSTGQEHFLGLDSEPARQALPAARDVLPDPAESEPAAGRVPASR